MESPPPVTGSGLLWRDEMKDTTVLCGANSYEQKYYFNQDFKSLPQSIRDELQIMCVMYTEAVSYTHLTLPTKA